MSYSQPACLPRVPPRCSAPARALALIALLAAPSGCSGGPAFKPTCPRAAVLADGADLTRFRPRGQDVTDMVLDGKITDVRGSCAVKDGVLQTEVAVSLEVARGPAAEGRAADFAYFIAVTEGDRILDKRIYTEHVAFPPNVERLRLAGEPVDLALPVTADKSGAAYGVIASFQLTPEELATNRRRGPR